MMIRWMVLGAMVAGVVAAASVSAPGAPGAGVRVEAGTGETGDETAFTEKDPLWRAAQAVRDWWPGDGHGMDLVGTRHATLKDGAGYAAGRVGKAFTFDGVSGLVDCGKGTPGEAFTMMMWFKGEAQPSFRYLAFCWGNQGMNISVNYEQPCVVGCNVGIGNGGLEFRGMQWEGANAEFDPYERWYHVTMTYDGTRIGSYRDGELAKEMAWGVYGASDSPLVLGTSDRQTECLPYKGQIEDVTLFGRALSAEEVAAVYGAQRMPKRWQVRDGDWGRFAEGMKGERAPGAWYAAQKLAGCGEKAAEQIRASARRSCEEGSGEAAGKKATVAELIAGLDSDSYGRREEATGKLREMGSGVVPYLREALEARPSAEAAGRLEMVLAGFLNRGATEEQVMDARVEAVVARAKRGSGD